MEIPDQIVKAYRELLNNEKYSKISVSRICAKASISRNTFYKYYSDKNEVSAAIFYEDLIKPTELLKAHFSSIDDMDGMSLILLRNTYQRVLNDRNAYENLLGGMGKAGFINLMQSILLKWTSSFAAEYDLSNEEQSYAANLLASSQVVVLVNWIENDFDVAPEQLAEFCNFWRFSNWRTVASRYNDKQS